MGDRIARIDLEGLGPCLEMIRLLVDKYRLDPEDFDRMAEEMEGEYPGIALNLAIIRDIAEGRF